MYVRRRHLFGARRWWFFSRDYEYLWPFADAWSALCTFGSLPAGGDGVFGLLGQLRLGVGAYGRAPAVVDQGDDGDAAGLESVVVPPLGRGGDRYYDDNAWLGLALVRHYELMSEPGLLRLARRVFDFVVSGWSNDASWAVPGGIRWKEPSSNVSRNTCANGPAAELAAKLHETTGEAQYSEWAARIYEWTRAALLRPDGLYDDQIAPDGTRNGTIWSYNQGSMIGAGVLLARQAGDASFLDQAVVTADAYLEGRGVPELLTQDPAFNAVLFRNLLLLDEERASADPRARELAAAYGSAMWTQQRLRHGFFAGKGSRLNNTAAMLQVYALIAGAPPHP